MFLPYFLMQTCLINFCCVCKNLNQINKFMFYLHLGRKFRAEDMSVSDLFTDDELFDILVISSIKIFSVAIYLFKVNDGNTRTRCEICSKLTIKTPERRHWHHSVVFIVNFELNFPPYSSVSILNFEHVNAYWI